MHLYTQSVPGLNVHQVTGYPDKWLLFSSPFSLSSQILGYCFEVGYDWLLQNHYWTVIHDTFDAT